MNRIFLLLLQILTINFFVTGQVDDTLTLTYSEYIKQNINGDYLILDIYGEPFKMVTIKDSLIVKEQIYVDSSLIYVDTTIMIGFNKNRININDKDNVSLIFKYSDYYLNPPKFESSDGDTVIFSFLLDENGKLISIKILKDVTKKCKDDSKWEIKYNESIKFN